MSIDGFTRMGSTGREGRGAPARSRESTRRRLLDAGAELFARRGFYKVSSTAIAHKAGVATGTFYLHFRDKQVLFDAIRAEGLDRLRGRLKRSAQRAQGRKQVCVRMEELIAFAEENPELILVLFGPGGERPGIDEELLDGIVPDIERLPAGRGPVPLHPAVAEQALVGMTVRAISWWVEHPACASRVDVLSTLLHMHPRWNDPG